MDNVELLEAMISDGEIDHAINLVKRASGYHEGEKFVYVALKNKNSTPELLEAALESFLNTRENRYQKHGYWVHSLSHFTKYLWERRMDDWIKKFNEVAFKGAIELNDDLCSDRLVEDFEKFSRYDDDPADFFITLENLSWIDWSHFSYIKARIEMGKFESEEKFLYWNLLQPEIHAPRNRSMEINLVDVKKIRSIIKRLQELGVDISGFDGFECDLLKKQLIELEKKLPMADSEWNKKIIIQKIKETRKLLV